MPELYSFEEWEKGQERDPEFVRAWKEMKLSYQISRLRLLRNLTQEELAEKIGTKQSSISRLENGKSKPNLGFLERVVKALDGVLSLNIYPVEKIPEVVDITDDYTANMDYPISIENWPTKQGVTVDDKTEKSEDQMVGVAL